MNSINCGEGSMVTIGMMTPIYLINKIEKKIKKTQSDAYEYFLYIGDEPEKLYLTLIL